MPSILLPGSPPRFPPVDTAAEDGLLAVGGDLSPKRLLAAYDLGIFPWYDEGLPPLWWSPDPRAVLQDADLHVSRSLARTLRRGVFEITWDRAFAEVIRACADERDEGTWLLPEMIDAYEALHELGHAHSVEAWKDGVLAGGLYGVHRGGLFAAESMFHRVTDASKAALVTAVRSLFRAGIEVFDVQLPTRHLTSLGATTWPRDRYVRRVAEVRKKPVRLDELGMRF